MTELVIVALVALAVGTGLGRGWGLLAEQELHRQVRAFERALERSRAAERRTAERVERGRF